MNVPLSAVLYQITDMCDYELQSTDISICYDGVQLFDLYDHFDDGKNYLYFISDDMLKTEYNQLLCTQLITKSPFLCGCSDGYQELSALCPDLSVVFLMPKQKCSFSLVFNKLLNTFRSFSYWSQTLHLSLLHGTSIQPILNITEPILSHPMVILDANLTVIGYVRKENEVDEYMELLLENGYATLDIVKKFKSLGIFPHNFQDKPLHIAHYQHPGNNPYYSMCYHLDSERQTCGYAIVFCCKKHPSNSYQYLMDMVIENISLYFRQERYSANKFSEKYEFFLTSLLQNPTTPITQLETQLAFIPGLSLKGNYQLARVCFSDDTKASFSFVSWNLRNTFPDFRPFVYENALYILKTASTASSVLGAFVEEDHLALFNECFTGCKCYCAVSHAFFELTGLPVALEQCTITSDKISKQTDRHLFCYFENYSLDYMLQTLRDSHTLSMTLSPFYQVLKEYDLHHGTDLCQVLSVYLQNGRSVNQTSSVLYMHRNTILNKVKKATQILGNEMNDYSLSLFFILSHLNDNR